MSLNQGKEIFEIINNYDNILVMGHTKPDGDALGSCIAMAHFLKEIGKKCVIFNETSIPRFLEWLELPVPFCRDFKKIPFKPKLFIVLDCGDLKRVGKSIESVFKNYPSINIDHHYDTPNFASLYNWCDYRMASTGQMVSEVIKAGNVALTGGIAISLHVSLVSDTGNFSYGNTSGETLRLAAELVENGLDIVKVNDNLKKQSTPEGLRLRGNAVSNFSLHFNNKVAMATVSLKDLATYRATNEETEGLVDCLRSLCCVDIAAIIRQDSFDNCKLSLRSSGTIDVRSIAQFFDGGGHINAAGAILNMNLESAKNSVLQKIEEYLQTRV